MWNLSKVSNKDTRLCSGVLIHNWTDFIHFLVFSLLILSEGMLAWKIERKLICIKGCIVKSLSLYFVLLFLDNDFETRQKIALKQKKKQVVKNLVFLGGEFITFIMTVYLCPISRNVFTLRQKQPPEVLSKKRFS